MKKTKFFMWILIIFLWFVMNDITKSQLLPIYPWWEDCVGNCWQEQILNNIATVTPWIDGDINTLTVCGHDYNNDLDWCITIMDRNIWATSNNINSSDSYWYYYQWWNNNWFPVNGSINTTSNQIDCSSYGPLSQFNSDIFFISPSWSSYDYCTSSTKNDNLWWGWDDEVYYFNPNSYVSIISWNNSYPVENVEERQWPCPDNYHIPSQWEWYALMDMWAGISVKWNIESNVSQLLTDLKIPRAGYREYNDGSLSDDWGHPYLRSSSPYEDVSVWSFQVSEDWYEIAEISRDAIRTKGYPIRCFKNPEPVLLSTINDFTTTTLWWNAPVTWLPETIIITQNTISIAEWKEVLWEVNVNFWSNQTATFSHPVQVNIPVSDYEQVYIKVKHWWSSEYNFDWLTTNSNASCNNWNVVEISNRYNWETINVVNGYATIYSCSASSFIALGLDVLPTVAQINLSVLKWTLTIWTEITNLNLWEVNVSNSAQELSWSFWVNSFWVEDMKWVESWFYTTISVTDLTWSVATHVISANNVYLKTAWSTPSNISWATASEAKVVFGNAITSWHNGSWQVNYFQRLNTSTAEAWRVWKWWDNLQVKVTIPAHTPYDTYRWTITYTLYDNDL